MGDAEEYELAVIGAGVNGAGIARDAALRGLKVIVLDKSDLCTATSAWSSRLIHGGLRYLEHYEIPLVYESLHERRVLRVIARHLVRPLRLCLPIYASGKRPPWLIQLGMLAYDVLSFRKKMPRHRMLSRDEILAEEPGLLAEGLRGAARYFDAQITFIERLVLENLLAARTAGAMIATYSEVTAINVTGGQVTSLEYRDLLNGQSREVRARVVVNAAGPWVDAVLDTTGRQTRKLIGGTKGSHIVVGAFEGAPTDAFYVEAAADGRPFFIIPWNHQYLIGTTDIRYEGDLDKTRASPAEIDYLLAETNRVFPAAKLDVGGIHYAYAGIRPLPHRDKGPESAITRRHIIKNNRRIASNLISIIGGKLTTYRHLAEQSVDRVARRLGRKLPECRTGDTPLPGAERIDTARATLAALETLSAAGVERLLGIYGGRALDVLELGQETAGGPQTLDAAATVLAAEVAFAIREEMAVTLTDIVHRRLMLGLDADQGRALYAPIAELAAVEFGWDAQKSAAEVQALIAYSDSFRVS